MWKVYLCIVKVFTHNFTHVHIFLWLWWAQMSFIGPIVHLKAKNCPSGPKTVPPRNLIVRLRLPIPRLFYVLSTKNQLSTESCPKPRISFSSYDESRLTCVSVEKDSRYRNTLGIGNLTLSKIFQCRKFTYVLWKYLHTISHMYIYFYDSGGLRCL